MLSASPPDARSCRDLIDQVIREVFAELEVRAAETEETWDLATSFVLATWLAGGRSTSDVAIQAIRAFIELGYPDYAPEAERLYGLDDELEGDWGRPRAEVMAEMEETLSDWARRVVHSA